MNIVKDYGQVLYKAGRHFFYKKGLTLASSSTFFALLTVVPFLLLMVRIAGLMIGNVARAEKYIFLLGAKLFPQAAPGLLINLQELIKGPLFADTSATFLNMIFLLASTFTFINSIWTGIYFITDDHSVLSVWRYLKGLALIAMTLLMISLIFILPPVIIFVIKFLQKNALTQFIWDNFDSFRPMLKWLMDVNLKKSYWLKSNSLHFVLVTLYISTLYRWLFSWKLSFKHSLLASLAFGLSLFVGKYLFYIYIYYVRSGMIRNYGELYTSVVGVIWLFYLMCFFFFGASVCYIYQKRAGRYV